MVVSDRLFEGHRETSSFGQITRDPFSGILRSTGGSRNPWENGFLFRSPSTHIRNGGWSRTMYCLVNPYIRWTTHFRGTWSFPENKLYTNSLELKAVLLALRQLKEQGSGKLVLIATYNTTVVAYIDEEEWIRSSPLETTGDRHAVTLKARHIPGRLNIVADKLSRLNQVIQTEWSFLPEVFKPYVSHGTLHSWTCSQPGSTGNSHSSCPQFLTRQRGQWTL